MPQTLFLMLGYPGAGKTTVAHLLKNVTGATTILADEERHKRYAQPTYTTTESHELYDNLNQQAEQLLEAGKSVIYDTNFRFYKDREQLRQLAARFGADTIIVSVVTPRDLAITRAVDEPHLHPGRNNRQMEMSDFDRLSNTIEPPHKDEKVMTIEGTHVTEAEIRHSLEQVQNSSGL